MSKLHPDVQIYLKRVVAHFKNNREHFTELFGTLPIKDCLDAIRTLAEENQKQRGEPNLTQEQFVTARQMVENPGKVLVEQKWENVFKKIGEAYPPLCLN